MSKRGPKTSSDSSYKGVGMTAAEIAYVLGISRSQVDRLLRSGIHKLSSILGKHGFSLLLDTIHAVDAGQHDLLQCGSLECDKEFQQFYGED